jgi:nucleoside-diphosphate-sugar epimerase
MTTSTTARGLVLVTGGSGYIAGYCIAQLLSEGWRVRGATQIAIAEKIGSRALRADAMEAVTCGLAVVRRSRQSRSAMAHWRLVD